MSHDSLAANPLLHWNELPPYASTKTEHVEPAMRHLLAESAAALDRLERDAKPTWEGLMEPLDRMTDPMERAWGVVQHFMGVKNSPELREVHGKLQPEIVRFNTRVEQSRPLYDAMVALRGGPQWAKLSEARRRIVETKIRDAELSGVGLRGAERDLFNAIVEELATLATKFGNNLLDSIKEYRLKLASKADVEGVPATALAMAAAQSRADGDAGATAEAGPWTFTQDMPSYIPFMKHAKRRDHRETLYRDGVTRASEGERDNGPIIERLLELRREMAKLLGRATYADVSLEQKMAARVAAVEELQAELLAVARPAAAREMDELRAFAAEKGHAGDLMHWDLPYWSERLRERRYDFNEEELRPYFPLPAVQQGMFDLAERLFGMKVIPANGDAEVWHDDVTFYWVERGGKRIAGFFLDPYSRPSNKRGGAWMGGPVSRSVALASKGSPVRLPIAVLCCNQTPPVDGKPSLMQFSEAKTLFHEFGHGLQHVLTTVDEGMASGTANIEWDAIELASQFMEYWLHHKPTLQGMARHYQTGEPLPDALFERLDAARNFQSGMFLLRQLNLGLVDMELHHRYAGPASGEDANAVRVRVSRTSSLLPPLPEDRYLCGFRHIFAGSYAAGYYSYLWSKVLASDAFGAFEEVGLDNETAVRELGARYRDTVLALGGGRHPMDVFRDFRGRTPSTAPLLRHIGLKATAAA